MELSPCFKTKTSNKLVSKISKKGDRVRVLTFGVLFMCNNMNLIGATYIRASKSSSHAS